MTLQRIAPVIPKQPEKRSLSRSSRSMGIYLLAGRGTGKSRMLGRKIAMQDFLAGFPQVIFDPVGGTVDNFWIRSRGFCNISLPLIETCFGIGLSM
jgi:hypothetical protein